MFQLYLCQQQVILLLLVVVALCHPIVQERREALQVFHQYHLLVAVTEEKEALTVVPHRVVLEVLEELEEEELVNQVVLETVRPLVPHKELLEEAQHLLAEAA